MPIALHTLLPDSGAAPDWVHLVPAGTFHGRDGRGPYRLADAEAVIRASLSDGKIPIDENHAIDLAAPSGGASPARGWIGEMHARADGIWGRVEWTPAGGALMAERAYRGISPALQHDAAGKVTRVLRAALVNVPNLPLHTLHHQQETGMDIASEIRQALGLPEAADNAAILAAARAATAAVATHAAQIAAIAGAAGVAATGSEGLVTALQAQRQVAADAGRLSAEMVSLQSRLHTMENDRARERAVAFMDGAVAKGKPVPPALRDHYIARHMADPASVEKEIGAMVSLHAGGLGHLPAVDTQLHAEDGLTPADRTVAKKMGLDPKKFADAKKKDAA